MIYIYILLDPRTKEVKYVGRTSDIAKRILKHNSTKTNVGTKKNLWIKELRAAGLKVEYEILEIVDKTEAPFWERCYTDLFRSWGFELLNNTFNNGLGNQTSFKSGEGLSEVVALKRDGTLHKIYPSVKVAKADVKKQIGGCLMKIKKTAGDLIWLYKKEYEEWSQKQIDDFVAWANLKNYHVNSGSFKKGHVSINRWN